MQFLITINDNSKAEHFIDFLKDIPYVNVIEANEKEVDGNSLFDSFGMWKDKDVSLDKIRAKAWKR